MWSERIILYLCTLQSDQHCNSSFLITIFHHHCQFCFLLMAIFFKVYSQELLNMQYSIINYSHMVLLP